MHQGNFLVSLTTSSISFNKERAPNTSPPQTAQTCLTFVWRTTVSYMCRSMGWIQVGTARTQQTSWQRGFWSCTQPCRLPSQRVSKHTTASLLATCLSGCQGCRDTAFMALMYSRCREPYLAAIHSTLLSSLQKLTGVNYASLQSASVSPP